MSTKLKYPVPSYVMDHARVFLPLLETHMSCSCESDSMHSVALAFPRPQTLEPIDPEEFAFLSECAVSQLLRDRVVLEYVSIGRSDGTIAVGWRKR